jgi:hypothetical protein
MHEVGEITVYGFMKTLLSDRRSDFDKVVPSLGHSFKAIQLAQCFFPVLKAQPGNDRIDQNQGSAMKGNKR